MAMMATWWGYAERLGPYLTLVVVIGAPVAWGALKVAAAKWLDSRFQRQVKAMDERHADALQRLEHRHDWAVRHLQSSIDRELRRAAALHDKEFEALGEAWRLLKVAFDMTVATVMTRLPDLRRMSAGEFSSFVAKSELEDWQKVELSGMLEERRNEYYRDNWEWRRLNRCHDARFEAKDYIDRHAIFLPPGFAARFLAIDEMIIKAVVEYQMRLERSQQDQRFAEVMALSAGGGILLKELENAIHARLWSASLEPATTPSVAEDGVQRE